MAPLVYHPGQIAVQEEARTRAVADKLAGWVGPAEQFAELADLVLLAVKEADVLRFAVLSGAPPIARAIAEGQFALPSVAPVIALDRPRPCGGLVMRLEHARRARLNGTLAASAGGCELRASERFTLCRKYMAPTAAVDPAAHVGPIAREPVALTDPWVAATLAGADTAFLASISPDGLPDVSHRGGPEGFVSLDPAASRVSWPEYLGDGVLKSAGNLRATKAFTLLVLAGDSGDAVELWGEGDYTNQRAERRVRTDALVQDRDKFPRQGEISGHVVGAARLRALTGPRKRVPRVNKLTSASAVDEQMPQ